MAEAAPLPLDEDASYDMGLRSSFFPYKAIFLTAGAP